MSERKWYDNKLLVVALLFFFFPVGAYGLWKSSAFSNNSKKIWGIAALCFLLFISTIEKNKQPPQAVKTPQTKSVKQVAQNKPAAAPLKREITSIEMASHMDDCEKILDEIEQRRKRLEVGDSYKNGAWLAGWNRDTQDWRRAMDSRLKTAGITRNNDPACYNASIYTSSGLTRLVLLGIGYVSIGQQPDGVSVEQKLLSEEYREAREAIQQCREALNVKVASQ